MEETQFAMVVWMVVAFAVDLLRHYVTLRPGALLGHTDKRATEIYAHVSDNRQREALRLVNAGPVDLGD